MSASGWPFAQTDWCSVLWRWLWTRCPVELVHHPPCRTLCPVHCNSHVQPVTPYTVCAKCSFLTERCNCVAKFGYCHDMLSVCLSSVCRPPSRRRISEFAAEFLSAEYQPKKNSDIRIKIEMNTNKTMWVLPFWNASEQLELHWLSTVLCLVY